MLSLKTLIASLEGRRKARLELVSGRRPRLVLEADGRRDQAEVKNLADQILTDDEVVALCEAAGAGKRLDALERGAASWSYFNGTVTFRVTVEMRGREIAATFVQGNGSRAIAASEAVAAPKRPSQPAKPRRTQPEIRALERALDRAAETPRSRRTLPPTGRKSEAPGPRRSDTPSPRRADASRRTDAPPRRSTVPPKQARRQTPRPAEARLPREDRPTAQDIKAPVEARRDERTGAPAPRTERSPTKPEPFTAVKAEPAGARTTALDGPRQLAREAPREPAPQAEIKRPAEPRPAPVARHEPQHQEPVREPHPAAEGEIANPPRNEAARPARVEATAPLRPEPAIAVALRAERSTTLESERTPERGALAGPIVVVGGPRFASVPWPAEHGSAAKLVPTLVEGRTAGASDLHLAPKRPSLLRIAGDLRPARASVAAVDAERAVLALVPEALRPSFEDRGAADFALDVPKLGRFRVSVTLTLRGPKAALRFMPREVPTLASLGLPEDLTDALKHHQGLILVTGPSGHGKTSTLAALVDHINAKTSHHVITIEDPIEIVHPPKNAIITQREVGTHTKSFARAVKGALRQDPDVVVVGELRDTETVRMALSASETGHLVLGTMNTPSAPATIDALIDLFPPGDQPQVRATLAGGLKYVISQRLVPKADGTGRAVAIETLPGMLPLWNLIRDQKTFQLPGLMQRGRGLGITRLNDSLVDLVTSGAVKKEDALAHSAAPEELSALLGGGPAPAEPAHSPLPDDRQDLVGSLLGRAGAFFSRKGGD